MIRRLALVALLGLAGTAFTATAAQAAIQFGLIQYNSPGTDTGSNASLNAEYAKITNTGSAGVALTNWTVRDAQGHVYKFGTYKLCGGCAVTLHTGHGTNTYANRYWNFSNYIWNNTGDRATLKNAVGTTKDTCSWGSSGPGYIRC
jgi:hypothetical protein